MLKSRLDTIAASLDNEIQSALRIAAERIEDGAKSRVPVDSGALRDAIHTEETDDGYVVVAGDSKVWYGMLVENGTTRTPARPFLIPAAEAVRDNLDELVRAAYRDL